MTRDTLQTFIAEVRSIWGPLTSDLVAGCRVRLEMLASASPREPWLADLHATAPANRELHRDPDHGFVLLAHKEDVGLYRPPHDHGRAWVVYAVQQGEIEMRTFARIEGPHGEVRLVQRDSVVLRAGRAQAYLPGDIHDTRCLSDRALLFRFTERDLRTEDLTRYAPPEGAWATGR